MTRQRQDARHSMRMFASFTTLRHFAISLRISLANASGVLPAGSRPIAAKRRASAGDLRLLLISALALPTMARGVPAG